MCNSVPIAWAEHTGEFMYWTLFFSCGEHRKLFLFLTFPQDMGLPNPVLLRRSPSVTGVF